ncbi:PssD/Cps14F family polysaccharide biosynthesis glycosyltransferase [Thomasclavelia cocleata]|uniref:PssD/Cps14F family polysaccharide biosynthesis glycosyltransferase n=1 Tax=Thomasclavelia cocleata TaxID=69824 RepID=UPI00242ADDF9|nr:PssD/Cps14F family polysaccharide biosynthesis glycosyltransferase [Thomasclavelia cocleata]
MKTGIVVLNYNDAQETINFVNEINSFKVLDYICVVDNCSTDDSLKKLQKLNNIHLIALDDNKGYAAGNNAGLEYLFKQDCDNYIIANPDIIIDKRNFIDFIAYMNSDHIYSIFGPTIVENGKINHGWKQKSIYYDIYDNYPIINRLFKNRINYRKSYYKGALTPVDCISGCFFGFKKEVIDKIGFLDEGTFLFYEEDIFCAKAKDKGLNICVLNDVKVIHNHSVTINKNINHYRKLRILKNSQLYYHQICFKHSRYKLKCLKKTGDWACNFAWLRTDKTIVNKHNRPKQKVTLLSLHLRVGGIEKAICSLANMLVDDYDVEIVNVYKLCKPSFYIDERVKITYLSTDLKPNKENLKYAVKDKNFIKIVIEGFKALNVVLRKKKLIKQCAKDNDGDIIISTTLAFNKSFSKYQKNKLLIAWEHCHPDRSLNYAKKVYKSVKKFDLFIPASKSIYNFYKEYLTGPQCIYLPLCIDELPDERAILNTNQVTVMGRLSGEKAYDDMLKIFKKVLEKNPEAKLNILGDGEERHSLGILADQLGIRKSVTFYGNIVGEAKREVMINTSVFVTTSHYESFGLVLLEAMSYGIPCISFDSAKGSLDIIEDGKDGFIIKNRNFDDMANRIVKLLKETPKEISDNGIKKAQQFSYQNVRIKWLEMFQSLNIHDLKTRIIFTSSAGGHFSELCELKELMERYNSFLITEDHEMMKEYKKINKSRSWYMPAGTKEHLFKFLCNFPINIIKSFSAYLKVKPDIVIATGAHTTVPICYIAKMFGKKVIFIETFANITTKTLSGKLVYPIADLFLVQWEDMLKLYPKAKYRGGLK